MNTRPLTARQQFVLNVIERAIEQNGYAPTYREIGDAVGIRSTNGVHDHLTALERKGYLALSSGTKARSLRVLKPQNKPVTDAGLVLLADIIRTARERGWNGGEIEDVLPWLRRELSELHSRRVAGARVGAA